MPAPKPQTYYEILGVPRDAPMHEIGRAYNRHKAALQRDTTMPDLKRATKAKEAYDVLSDPEKREAYDATLFTKAGKRAGGAVVWGVVIAVIAGAGATGWLALRPEPPALPTGARTMDQLLFDTSRSVGRVDSIDMSGRTAPLGVAFAIGEGVMVTSCRALPSGAQLVVHIAKRKTPARVMTTDDKRGLCKISVEGVGSWPLEIREVEPRQGDRVYATKVNSVGQVALVEGTVKSIRGEAHERAIESNIPPIAESAGGPLFDAYGLVLGVATAGEDAGSWRHVQFPRTWLAELREAAAPKRPQPTPEPAATEPATAAAPGEPPVPKVLRDVPPERKKALEEAFRPPPKVPDDL